MTISDYDVDIRTSYQLSSQQQLMQMDQDFKRKDYKIAYWTQNADGSGRRYALEETLQAAEVSADLDFYAQWKKLGLVFTATNGRKSYFDASDPYILSILGYVNSGEYGKVGFPYSQDANISNFNSVVAVDDNDNEITCIREYAFYECTNLLSVNLPAVTWIQQEAFYNCTNLYYVGLPVIDYSFQMGQFFGCTNLSIINLSAVTRVPTTDDNTFDHNNKLTAIVPSALVDNFRNGTNWVHHYATGNLTLNLPHKTDGGYWKGEIYGLPVTYCMEGEQHFWRIHADIDHDLYYEDGVWILENEENFSGNGTETHLQAYGTNLEWTPNNPFPF